MYFGLIKKIWLENLRSRKVRKLVYLLGKSILSMEFRKTRNKQGTILSHFNRSGFNSPKLASFLIHKVYIKCLGACPEDLYLFLEVFTPLLKNKTLVDIICN